MEVKKMIKAVLFDLDGTLVNSLEDLADSTNYALKVSGYKTHETEKFKYFVGDGMPKLIERVLPEDKRNQEEIEKVLDIFLGYYKEHFTDKTKAYDGIYELISNIKEMGLKTAIISNKAHNMTLEVVDKLFKNTFDIVFGKKEGYPTKPDPKLTLILMEELGVKPEECILVGDSGMDAKAAVNAGCVGIGVLWGFRGEEELRQNGASYIVNAPSEIIDIIKRINDGK